MTAYDIFNGDADGLFALHQLRLHEARDAVLVTGVKRDVALLAEVDAKAGDRLTVLDIGLSENIDALMRALHAGAACSYFDHHFPGPIPHHPLLDAHIHCSADTCTSLIVNAHIGGGHRAWAVAAAFGDNLPQAALATAESLHLSDAQLQALAELGRLVNYNAYGDSVDELHFHPAELYARLHRYADPFQFIAREDCVARLRAGFHQDIALARAVPPLSGDARHMAIVLPDASWARRVSGVFANELAQAAPARAHAVLTRKGGHFGVSIRAPIEQPSGADALARRFPSGGGRPGAAGINQLPEGTLPEFLGAFRAAFD